MSGPPPKRSEERRRRNKDVVETIKVNLDELLAGEIEIPAPPVRRVTDSEGVGMFDPETGEELWESAWHPTAEMAYRDLAKSGQAIFMEPSDWALAYIGAEQLSLNLEPRPVVIGEVNGEPVIRTMQVPMPGATLNAFIKLFADLMATEGQRRRLRIELDRKKRQDEAMSGDGKVVPISQERQNRFKKEVQK